MSIGEHWETQQKNESSAQEKKTLEFIKKKYQEKSPPKNKTRFLMTTLLHQEVPSTEWYSHRNAHSSHVHTHNDLWTVFCHPVSFHVTSGVTHPKHSLNTNC